LTFLKIGYKVDGMSTRIKWTFEKIHAEALKYKTRWDFVKYSPNAYAAAARNGI
jgi:hypothetical protein